LHPESLPTLPKNIAKNFAKYFHKKGRGLVDLELERMKDQIQEKAEIFARSVLGEADAGNLRNGAPGSGGDEAPE